jgi:hypothetical protein
MTAAHPRRLQPVGSPVDVDGVEDRLKAGWDRSRSLTRFGRGDVPVRGTVRGVTGVRSRRQVSSHNLARRIAGNLLNDLDVAGLFKARYFVLQILSD